MPTFQKRIPPFNESINTQFTNKSDFHNDQKSEQADTGDVQEHVDPTLDDNLFPPYFLFLTFLSLYLTLVK